MKLAIWHVQQPSLPCLKIDWGHVPDSCLGHSKQGLAFVFWLDFVEKLDRRWPQTRRSRAGDQRPDPWSPQTQPTRPQAQLLVAKLTELRLRICQCLGFSRPRASHAARLQLRLSAVCLHDTGFISHRRHAQGKIHCILSLIEQPKIDPCG